MTSEVPRQEVPEAKIKRPGVLAKPTVSALWELSHKFLKPRVEDPQGHLGEAKKHLAQGKPLIVFINHSTIFLDPNRVGHVIEDNLTSLDNVGTIIAISQFDPQKGYVTPEGSLREKLKADFIQKVRKTQYWIIDNASKTKGFKLVTVIREKDRTNYGDRYSKPGPATNDLTPELFNRASYRSALEFIKGRGKVFMLAPEGGVNQDGVLTKAEEGLGDLLRIGRKDGIKAMGIALTPTAYRGGSARPTRLYSYEEAMELKASLQEKVGQERQVSLSDALMTPLAAHVPSQYQGYYKPLVEAARPLA